jgi:hypothetical protein
MRFAYPGYHGCERLSTRIAGRAAVRCGDDARAAGCGAMRSAYPGYTRLILDLPVRRAQADAMSDQDIDGHRPCNRLH